MAEKQYGLINPQKSASRLAAFNSDSDSDDKPAKNRPVIGLGESQKRQVRIAQENALKEDPTIFQYDELYDDMNNEREEAKKMAKEKQSQKSKYVERLLATAEKRKLDYERRIERQVQKERETEGNKYKDKESFVTASYRAKLEEMKIAEEADKREEYLESIGDVTKQKDLGGFYRHLYEQKLGPEKKEEASSSADVPKEQTVDEDKEKTKSLNKSAKKARTYRKRISHENDNEKDDDNEDAETKEKKRHLQSNIDADSDFSIDDSDSDDETSEKEGTKKTQATEEKESHDEGVVKPAPPIMHTIKKVPSVEKRPSAPPKPKIDIWKKRTVGEAFYAALKRYYERKELKCQ